MTISAVSDSPPAKFYSDPDSDSFSPKMTVFCDLDGPIVDVSDRYYTTYKLALADTQAAYQAQGVGLNITLLSKQEFWEMKRERVPDAEIAKSSGLQDSQIDEFRQRVMELVNQPELLHLDRLQPGVQWAIALLHSRGVRLVLVTLRSQSQATQLLQNYGLARLFTCIRGTQVTDAAYNNYANLKTQLLDEVVEELDSSIDSAWMIGDTEADIIAGQALGIPTIAVTCGIRSTTQLDAFQPTRILSDLVCTAHHLLTVNC
ncbi:HAD family hydrolase [Kamptonema sp. UHCC 0994]|uniref:HAD family hydrolase n=1 Tax=Kamptonema sp. UHCC 0994 TaxID=3031329 RepID=UPI0023B90AA8|nr:HAD family hydrolase [Kamptonema sp. UHCC 0994]MDF0551732.1 HAD family hydrolase [Kamptonema sp. UHCC 0994]